MLGLLTLWYPNDDLTFLNVGFAGLNEREGLFLEGVRDVFDKYRLQLYHYCVVKNGGIHTMENKTLLETGCGRGGGLNYIATLLRP